MKLARMIGTVFGVGYLKPAPGTWGSFVALPWAFLLHQLGGFPLLLLGVIAAFLKGWWATAKMTEGSEDHDPSEIVIDEVVGQWIALLPLSYVAWSNEFAVHVLWPAWILSFGLFRLFDIWKPWLVGWADRRGDALGVMLDDVIAGVFAAVSLWVISAAVFQVATG